MNKQIEELLNDPGNYTILKHLSDKEKQGLDKISEETGIASERVKHKSEVLKQEKLVERNYNSTRITVEFSEENRGKLGEIQEGIENFMEEKDSTLSERMKEEKLNLEKALKKLEYEKEETSVVKKEKELDRKISAVESTLEKLEGVEDDHRKRFEAFSESHRLLIFLDEREQGFHGFNPARKVKTLEKIEELLDQRPEEKEQRRFFGNRWVTSSDLE